MANKLSLLFIGDIVGNAGLKITEERLPELIKRFSADVVIVNGENADGGKGIVADQADMLFKLGVDVITSGNHIWDNWGSKPLLYNEERLIRPANYPQGNPGMSYRIFETKDGVTVAVMQLQGRIFMPIIDCPFKSAEKTLPKLQKRTDVIIVDVHAEATAEKQAMGWYLDGKVSAVIGTHTHVQTSDANILPKGTAYITDAGMTGSFDSVLGMSKDVAYKRMLLGTAQKYEQAEEDPKISGVCIEIDSLTGQALKITAFCEPVFITDITNDIG